MSRELSVPTHWLFEKYIGLNVIECDNLEELGMMWSLIGALSGALVEVRVDTGGRMNSGGAQWQECVKFYLQGQQLGHGNAVQEAA